MKKENVKDEKWFYGLDDKRVLIRPCIPSDSVNEITELLHLSYKQLADLGFRYLATHQDTEETTKRLNKGYSYLALSDGRIIGTITLYEYDVNRSDSNFYSRKKVCHFGQFAIHPDFQKKGIGDFMVSIVESKAKELGAEEIALDTAEGAKHLIDYYKRRGYRFVEYAQWDVTNYRSVIMSKKIVDS